MSSCGNKKGYSPETLKKDNFAKGDFCANRDGQQDDRGTEHIKIDTDLAKPETEGQRFFKIGSIWLIYLGK